MKSSDWHFVGLQCVLVTLLQAIGPDTFNYDHNWIQTGEIWRLVSAHWVHVGWTHMGLNLLGLAICVSLTHPDWTLKRWALQSLCLAVGISTLFTLLNPEVHWYAGFSGVLFGLYILAAVDLYARDRLIALLIGSAITVKVVIEQFTPYDFNTASLIGAPVIVDAHLYGLLMAIAIALVWTTYTMNQRSTRQSN